MVLTDWNGSYGYQNTGNAKSMQELYTVVNSGNYTIEDPNEGKMDNMTKIFILVDSVIGILSIGIPLLVLMRYFKKIKPAVIEVVAKEEA